MLVTPSPDSTATPEMVSRAGRVPLCTQEAAARDSTAWTAMYRYGALKVSKKISAVASRSSCKTRQVSQTPMRSHARAGAIPVCTAATQSAPERHIQHTSARQHTGSGKGGRARQRGAEGGSHQQERVLRWVTAQVLVDRAVPCALHKVPVLHAALLHRQNLRVVRPAAALPTPYGAPRVRR